MTAKSAASEGKKKGKGRQVDQAESTEQRQANDAAAAARRARKAEEQRTRVARDAQYSATVRFARSPARSRASAARRAGK